MKSLGKFTPRRTREKTELRETERKRSPENQREDGTRRTREKTRPGEPERR